MKILATFCILVYLNTFLVGQNAPNIFTTSSCSDSYIGSVEISFNHDLNVFPLPYNASFYNKTYGDFKEFIIDESTHTILNLNSGEFEIDVWLDEETIMEFCAEVLDLLIKVDI